MPPLDTDGVLEVDKVTQIEAIDVADVSCVFYCLFLMTMSLSFSSLMSTLLLSL